jgi:hypothetical protein
MNKPKCKTYSNGNKRWYLNDKRHREDGPACEYPDGAKVWYLNGKRHREDGPAVEHSNGDKAWWLNGKLHREDGPAREYVNGHKEWWLNSKEANPETIVDLWLAKNIYCFYNAETNSLEFE